MSENKKVTLFLRGIHPIWERFKLIAGTEAKVNDLGNRKPLRANQAIERLMRVAIHRDRLPTIGEVKVPEWLAWPPWVKRRVGDGPPPHDVRKPLTIEGISPSVRDHFKALCARRRKTLTTALSMLMVLAIEKGKIPKGKLGE